VTPADLAEMLKTTAAAVARRAWPRHVPRCRPPSPSSARANPEHGDYATNLALQLGKKIGANPA